ncbi:MAG TPA: 50S ribosomal protein L35 [bacterium]|jgi:large subunit ribosomal protein L35|nr:MAG: 50S ribosomal protein L35 [Parcubacteria group bacterium ADurb.Bin115]HNU81636.1 50S ribosomal protein L35 [bacterium]HOD87203.1 50S ribosomal protein L35 [bacterium]HPW05582.1 50S ribosomal protein L35 [bacterium]HPY99193.1 50S ribosomal protein L35 [bacterium]
MPKIKTHRATAKRFRLTAANKLKKRKSGQDHFNSRETGNTKRAKRLDINADKTLVKIIKTLTPYR